MHPKILRSALLNTTTNRKGEKDKPGEPKGKGRHTLKMVKKEK